MYLVTGAAGFCMVAPNAFCIIIAVSLSLPASPNLHICKYVCDVCQFPYTKQKHQMTPSFKDQFRIVCS